MNKVIRKQLKHFSICSAFADVYALQEFKYFRKCELKSSQSARLQAIVNSQETESKFDNSSTRRQEDSPTFHNKPESDHVCHDYEVVPEMVYDVIDEDCVGYKTLEPVEQERGHDVSAVEYEELRRHEYVTAVELKPIRAASKDDADYLKLVN